MVIIRVNQVSVPITLLIILYCAVQTQCMLVLIINFIKVYVCLHVSAVTYFIYACINILTLYVLHVYALYIWLVMIQILHIGDNQRHSRLATQS